MAACGAPSASAGSELLYWRDANGFYCPPMALECAFMRGYQECMESNDCHHSREDLLASLEMCETRGCSAVQCGLAAYQDPLACQHRFIGCTLSKEHNASGEEFSCRCTRQYVACQAMHLLCSHSCTRAHCHWWKLAVVPLQSSSLHELHGCRVT